MTPKSELSAMGYVIDGDPKALRRGVDRVLVHLTDWDRLDCPLSLKLPSGPVIPVYPTGRKAGRYTWYYRKRPHSSGG